MVSYVRSHEEPLGGDLILQEYDVRDIYLDAVQQAEVLRGLLGKKESISREGYIIS